MNNLINIKDSIILIVDDNPRNIQVLGKILSSNGFNPAIATSGQQAIAITRKKKPDLILLDVMMPEMDGFETCQIIKKDPEIEHIPIIFLTAKTELNSKIKGFELGAADYITKPFESLEVLKRIETHLKLKKVQDMLWQHNVELADRLEQRTRSLILAERHAAFSLLIQGIIHNFRNALTGLFGYSEILVEKQKELLILLNREPVNLEQVKSLTEKIIPFGETIINRAYELNKMVTSMMVKGRSDKSEKIELADLNEIIQSELDFYKADMFFKHNTRKEIQLSDTSLKTHIVPGEIRQVFQNLVGNALHAMDDTEKPELLIKSGLESNRVWFSISDNGSGIPLEIQNKIFDPFFTTKPTDPKDDKPTGTGLGLYMTMQTVKSYDGEIVLESTPGKGTCFTIYLPAA